MSYVEMLALGLRCLQHIQVRSNSGETTAGDLGSCSPYFIWLLRDFFLDLK